MSRILYNLDYTIKELKNTVSEDQDPFLLDILDRLLVIKRNQLEALIVKAYINEKHRINTGYTSFSVSSTCNSIEKVNK